ncbi:unnamed protein product [Toxocara canis]|uniref:Uncharacterized protein n=1 Tax=Toxocara canis TaxID=6265 RepID=A0A183V695_TOXCA|nr:unnamed protein product [Toxocara canis]
MSSSTESQAQSQNGAASEEQNGAASEETKPVVRMRNKTPLTQTQAKATKGNNGTLSVLQRGLDALNEVSPELDEGAEG